MAAQIIPFPKLSAVGELAPASSFSSAMETAPRARGTASGLHLVLNNERSSEGQNPALRIVEAVCFEHGLPHPAAALQAARSAEFWAKLPMPIARVENPVSVAKRLAHMLLLTAEHA